MLDFQQIKDQYPENLNRFERAILREYLQVRSCKRYLTVKMPVNWLSWEELP